MFYLRTFTDVITTMLYIGALGALVGTVSSLTRPPYGRSKAAFGIDNRLRRPRAYPTKLPENGRKRRWSLDLGTLGPALVGAFAAIFVVFSTGVQQVVDPQVKAGTTAPLIDAINWVKLVVLAFAGGAAGDLVFRTLATGNKVTLGGATEAARSGIDKALAEREKGADSAAAHDAGMAAVTKALPTPATHSEE